MYASKLARMPTYCLGTLDNSLCSELLSLRGEDAIVSMCSVSIVTRHCLVSVTKDATMLKLILLLDDLYNYMAKDPLKNHNTESTQFMLFLIALYRA